MKFFVKIVIYVEYQGWSTSRKKLIADRHNKLAIFITVIFLMEFRKKK